MELLDYYFEDEHVLVETITGDHLILLDDFWNFVVETDRNTYFSSYFDQVREETVEQAGIFENIDTYISSNTTKQLEKDLTDYINEKITHNRNSDLVSSES